MAARTGRIAGRVLDARGQPVGGATVLIARGPAHPDIAALTGQAGTYSFTDLQPGRYEVLAGSPAHGSSRMTVAVSAGEAASLDFHLAG